MPVRLLAGKEERWNKGQRCASRSYRATANPGTEEPLNSRTGYEMASGLVAIGFPLACVVFDEVLDAISADEVLDAFSVPKGLA